jgi:hypothetical protein
MKSYRLFLIVSGVLISVPSQAAMTFDEDKFWNTGGVETRTEVFAYVGQDGDPISTHGNVQGTHIANEGLNASRMGNGGNLSGTWQSSSAGSAVTTVGHNGASAYASTQSTPGVYFGDYQYPSGYAASYWKDEYVLTGGTGRAQVTFSGHVDGHFSNAEVRSDGTRATYTIYAGDALYHAIFQPQQMRHSECWSCTATYSQNYYEPSTDRSVAFTLKPGIEYGTPFTVKSMLAAASSFGDGLVGFGSTAVIDSILVPTGTSLTAASGRLEFHNGAYSYIPAVPEPSQVILFLGGIVIVIVTVSAKSKALPTSTSVNSNALFQNSYLGTNHQATAM